MVIVRGKNIKTLSQVSYCKSPQGSCCQEVQSHLVDSPSEATMTARSVDKGSDMQIFIFFLPYYTVSEASGCLKTLYVHSNLSQAVRDAQPAVGTQVFPKRTRKLCYLQQVQASSQRCFQPLTLFSVSLNIHKNRNIYTSLGYIILDGKKYSLCKF